MKINALHTLFLTCNAVCTDTRKVTKNDIFFALKGDNFNGNTFAKQAIEKGAKYAVIDEEKYNTSKKTILVKDVLKTLQKLASYHRSSLRTPIIALTGSNGKTTTKELINAVLFTKYKTKATKGNLNNHIGVPLTLLTLKDETEIGIVEMGANHLKEIAFLSAIVNPDYGYITNFGKAHLEGFGSIQGVIEGKSELYNYLTENGKSVFFNVDDVIQEEKLKNYTKKIGFSETNTNYNNIKLLETNPYVVLEVDNLKIKTKLIGNYNFTNICAAITIGKYFKVPLKDIKKGIENYKPTNNRSQIINNQNYKIILDAYNANPTSMRAALINFNNLKDNYKIAYLGDMFELGKDAEKEHQAIANLASKLNINEVILVGKHFYETKNESKNIKTFKSFEALKNGIDINNTKKTAVLIKGSRGMALERILDLL